MHSAILLLNSAIILLYFCYTLLYFKSHIYNLHPAILPLLALLVFALLSKSCTVLQNLHRAANVLLYFTTLYSATPPSTDIWCRNWKESAYNVHWCPLQCSSAASNIWWKFGAMCIELDRWIVEIHRKVVHWNTLESGTLEYIGIHWWQSCKIDQADGWCVACRHVSSHPRARLIIIFIISSSIFIIIVISNSSSSNIICIIIVIISLRCHLMSGCQYCTWCHHPCLTAALHLMWSFTTAELISFFVSLFVFVLCRNTLSLILLSPSSDTRKYIKMWISLETICYIIILLKNVWFLKSHFNLKDKTLFSNSFPSVCRHSPLVTNLNRFWCLQCLHLPES